MKRSSLKNKRRVSTRVLPLLSLLICGIARADDLKTVSSDAPTQGLPLKQVSLFSSGVGYFGRSGQVDGEGNVELYFRRDDLNDVLKSLVVTDPSGELQPATYALDELLARRPASNSLLPIPPSETLGGILRNFQGVLIEIESNGKTIRGRLMGVGIKTIKDPHGDVMQIEVANILTDSGLAAFRLDGLDDGGVVRLLDPILNNKLRSQLETSAGNLTQISDAGFRPITLHFSGRGPRTVKAGYIQATSVWKTSYRLVFDSKKSTPAPKDKKEKDKKSADENGLKPLLQGWAIVENTTDEDWKNIQLSLVAGRPVSFVMNLAAPLYVQRPEVPLPFAGAPASQVYEESLEAAKSPRLTNAPITTVGERGPQGAAGPLGAPGVAGRTESIFSSNFDRRNEYSARDEAAASAQAMMKQQAQASAAEKGDLFEYAIRQPVSLKRGEAALVPIVSQGITGDKLSILNLRDETLRAVHGMRICNTTGLHLAGGPLTIYEDGLYAGDAQITSIAPGENRLISYALDLDLVVGREAPTTNEQLVGLSAKSGVPTVTNKQRKVEVLNFRNKADEDKTVLVQMPIDPDYKLVEPEKPTDKTPTEYRFEIPVAAKDKAQLKVVSEQTLSETVALFDADIDAIIEYWRYGKISPELKNALQGVVARRRKVLDLQGKRAYLESQIKTISDEQTRIRNNMNSLSQTSDLYKRYVEKLGAQETQIEKLRGEIARLREAENDAAKDLRAYVDTLDVNG